MEQEFVKQVDFKPGVKKVSECWMVKVVNQQRKTIWHMQCEVSQK